MLSSLTLQPLFSNRVARGQADVCVQCLLQIAMNSSPHLDWVVAHIGYVLCGTR